MPINPVVSVCMITYNHEQYISEAIEGVLMQKTSFPIELIISDDCSKDRTREIVMQYAQKYPNIIFADFPTKNRGMILNVKHNLSLVSGRYVAFCEGDDYWTDPFKLQKQADYLDAHKDCGLVYGKATHYIQSSGKFSKVYGNGRCDFESLLFRLPMLTLTSCFRYSILQEYENENIDKSNWKLADSGLMIYTALKSKIHFIDENFGVYRVLNKSASHSPDSFNRYEFLCSYIDISMFFVNKYYSGIRKKTLLDKLVISKLWIIISIAGQRLDFEHYEYLRNQHEEIKKLPKTIKQQLLYFSSRSKLFYKIVVFALRLKHGIV